MVADRIHRRGPTLPHHFPARSPINRPPSSRRPRPLRAPLHRPQAALGGGLDALCSPNVAWWFVGANRARHTLIWPSMHAGDRHTQKKSPTIEVTVCAKCSADAASFVTSTNDRHPNAAAFGLRYPQASRKVRQQQPASQRGRRSRTQRGNTQERRHSVHARGHTSSALKPCCRSFPAAVRRLLRNRHPTSGDNSILCSLILSGTICAGYRLPIGSSWPKKAPRCGNTKGRLDFLRH